MFLKYRAIIGFVVLAIFEIAYVIFFHSDSNRAGIVFPLILAAEVGSAKFVADGNLAEKRNLGFVRTGSRTWSIIVGVGIIGMAAAAFLISADNSTGIIAWILAVMLSLLGKIGYSINLRND